MNVPSLLYLLAATALLGLALSPPVDARVDASFAWHMAQHLVLLFAVPFCLVAAGPFQLFSAVARKDAVARTVRATRPMHVAAHPVLAFAFFVATLWATHFSGLYELALEHTWVHVAEHALYLTAGVFFWLPVLAPRPLRPLPYPVRLLYLFIALPQGALLAFALGSARHVLYAHYATVNGAAAALADQNNAAAVMWIAGGLVVFVAFLTTFGRWAARESAASATLCIALLGAATPLPPAEMSAPTPAPSASVPGITTPTEPPVLVTPPKTPKGTTVTPPPSMNVPSYTDAQARAGQTLFYEHCAECHGASGEGNWAPALLVETGNVQWQPVYYVYSYMQQHMPAGDAEALSKDQYINIMAFLLKAHGHAAGSAALTDKTLMNSGALLGAKQP